jgi:hypothetical protein
MARLSTDKAPKIAPPRAPALGGRRTGGRADGRTGGRADGRTGGGAEGRRGGGAEGRRGARRRHVASERGVLCLAGLAARTVRDGGESAASALRVICMPCRPSDPLRCASWAGRQQLRPTVLRRRPADRHSRGGGDHLGGEECGYRSWPLDGPNRDRCVVLTLRLFHVAPFARLAHSRSARLHLLRLILVRPSLTCRSSFSTYTSCRSRWAP